MAISGATKADAHAAARKYGGWEPDMQTLLNVSSVSPTVTATPGSAGIVTIAWTNLEGPKYIDLGDGKGVRGPISATDSSKEYTGVTAGTYTATVFALGANKKSASYTVV